ncbi:Protein VACUOLELESS1 [Zea mays]|uniref:Protein VACUOLELESS1 n=2 Tax=Zea mays TaxID=4577 RepID=A0A1D6G108_MAIZE|nr:Protein VACUOLELESS1 [Zea mays]PWZ09697.1 Protein VACUOLELESS1 [Zea mays]
MSSSVSIAAEWDLLSDRFYRRLTLYSPLPWSTPAAAGATSSSSGVSGAVIGRLDLSTHIVAAAPFGGPIAAVRDDSKIVQLHSEPSRRRVLLFSSSGHPIASAPWPPLLPRLHSLGFSSSLSLLALLSDGSLLRFRLPDLQPSPCSSPVPLLPPASGGVADALFWGGGVAILTEDNRVVVATDIEAYDNYQLISSSLPEAIEACIDAAGHEFDVSRQRTLLRAATYGLAFCSRFPHERFQEMCKMLRVLNAVRDPEIGMPLTIHQYKEVVIMHWACEKITASTTLPDTVLLDGLLDKVCVCRSHTRLILDISTCSGYVKGYHMLQWQLMQITVVDEGWLQCSLIMSHSPLSRQIPLLLSIDEQDKALSKAIESGDTDLVYLVLFHIWQKVAVEKKAPLDFFGVINARPVARDLFMAYARHSKHEELKDFFLSTGRLQVGCRLSFVEGIMGIGEEPHGKQGVSSP